MCVVTSSFLFFFFFFLLCYSPLSSLARNTTGKTPAAVKTDESELCASARSVFARACACVRARLYARVCVSARCERRRAGKATSTRPPADRGVANFQCCCARARIPTGGGRGLGYWLTVPANRRRMRVNNTGKERERKKKKRRKKNTNARTREIRLSAAAITPGRLLSFYGSDLSLSSPPAFPPSPHTHIHTFHTTPEHTDRRKRES